MTIGTASLGRAHPCGQPPREWADPDLVDRDAEARGDHQRLLADQGDVPRQEHRTQRGGHDRAHVVAGPQPGCPDGAALVAAAADGDGGEPPHVGHRRGARDRGWVGRGRGDRRLQIGGHVPLLS